MNIKITYRRDADHPQHGGRGGEQWTVEADGIDGYDGDKAVQAVLDAGALMKAAAYGNAKLIVEGLKGWSGAAAMTPEEWAETGEDAERVAAVTVGGAERTVAFAVLAEPGFAELRLDVPFEALAGRQVAGHKLTTLPPRGGTGGAGVLLSGRAPVLLYCGLRGGRPGRAARAFPRPYPALHVAAKVGGAVGAARFAGKAILAPEFRFHPDSLAFRSSHRRHRALHLSRHNDHTRSLRRLDTL